MQYNHNPLLLMEGSKDALNSSIGGGSSSVVDITAYPKELHEEGDDPDFIKYARNEAVIEEDDDGGGNG